MQIDEYLGYAYEGPVQFSVFILVTDILKGIWLLSINDSKFFWVKKVGVCFWLS